MSRYTRPYSNAEKKVGRIILMPLKFIFGVLFILIFAVACVVLYIPGVIFYLLKVKEVPLVKRIPLAFTWPLQLLGNVLAMNDFLSLGGFDSPTLTRFTTWLNSHKR